MASLPTDSIRVGDTVSWKDKLMGYRMFGTVQQIRSDYTMKVWRAGKSYIVADKDITHEEGLPL